ncbi:MAG: hypothetical protein K940chlam8_01143 [Chlamydiae bacterium]|nr:hypothetical protein [Chlamydiota bacterium]
MKKRWHVLVILLVGILTIYNILPTLFYYSKPLRQEVGKERAFEVVREIQGRFKGMEKENVEWTQAFCKLHGIEAKRIDVRGREIEVEFGNVQDAERFKKYLPRAGAMRQFVANQLSLIGGDDKIVRVGQKVEGEAKENWFWYGKKMEDERYSDEYQNIVFDRTYEVVRQVVKGGMAKHQAQLIAQNDKSGVILTLAGDLQRFCELFGKDSDVVRRYFSLFGVEGSGALFEKKFDEQVGRFKRRLGRIKISKAGKKDASIAYLNRRIEGLEAAKKIVVDSRGAFKHVDVAIDREEVLEDLYRHRCFYVGDLDVFVKQVDIDWERNKICVSLHEDVLAAFKGAKSEEHLMGMQQLVMQHIAYLSKQSGEKLEKNESGFVIHLNQMKGMQSFLAIDLKKVARQQVKEIKNLLMQRWEHGQDVIVCDQFEYLKLSKEDQEKAIVVFAGLLKEHDEVTDLNKGSIYVCARGLAKKIKEVNGKSEAGALLVRDFTRLSHLLRSYDSMLSYPGTLSGLDRSYQDDFFFEIEHFYSTFLKTTREDFKVLGSKELAVLEFTDVEERILAKNRVESQIHEELLKWRDDYNAAQANLDKEERFFMPKPAKSALLSNVLLSVKKYFRGDNRKILRWGLDLSGGKTVQVELIDQDGKVVGKEEDVKQAINELYTRVNRLGVSEVAIHQEGNNIVLDFPGSQNLTARELITGSSMKFHIVNERFSRHNGELWVDIDRFLSEIWNEALVTNQTETRGIQYIAWKHLGGDRNQYPMTESARVLKEAGLKLAHPDYSQQTVAFDDTMSQVGVLRGDDPMHWGGQMHPLVILFQNYALQGAQLENIRSGYDPTQGNYLSFAVSNSFVERDGVKLNPQENLYAWTSHFAKDKIAGTLLAQYSAQQNGWRMAVVLNDQIISSPGLHEPISASGQINGGFTQREIRTLEADLKAGSLSFKPKILSEMNVSPQLGKQERTKGITATVLALIGVMISMIAVYRFGGVVASIAVLFNLLILWAVYQNLQAAMSLAGIAGVILTIGMAVDANVLVFERIREEFQETGKLAHSVAMGYKKAFSAIVDSNVTTILAALILLQFDSGPIKGFAVAIIIGIGSSMFTALFVTRYFFTHWVKNPKRHTLSMAKLFSKTNFAFLKHAPKILALSCAIIAIGLSLLVKQKNTIFGMDFTGGNALTVSLEKEGDKRAFVERALEKQGLDSSEFEVRTLDKESDVRLYFSASLNQPGKIFYELEQHANKEAGNPKIKWVLDALQLDGLHIEKASMEQAYQNWTEVSGQLSDTMRNQALLGLCIALLGIMIYITIRFESKYALASIICLIHDVFVTLGVISLLRWFGLGIQIDLNTIAAMMTIIGYSLNDTIVIFDRLREDLGMRRGTMGQTINHALNATLNRTMMTSITTLVVLVLLVLFGGPTIFSFALVMSIGVVFGTLSSLFLAGPALMLFEKRLTKKT